MHFYALLIFHVLLLLSRSCRLFFVFFWLAWFSIVQAGFVVARVSVLNDQMRVCSLAFAFSRTHTQSNAAVTAANFQQYKFRPYQYDRCDCVFSRLLSGWRLIYNCADFSLHKSIARLLCLLMRRSVCIFFHWFWQWVLVLHSMASVK